MSWESMITKDDLIHKFLNKNLQSSVENFIRVNKAEHRTDPINGVNHLLIEICLSHNTDSFEYTGFKVSEQVSKYLKIISVYDVPHITIVNEHI